MRNRIYFGRGEGVPAMNPLVAGIVRIQTQQCNELIAAAKKCLAAGDEWGCKCKLYQGYHSMPKHKPMLHMYEDAAIRKLHEAQKLDGYALIPLSVYFKNGLVKVELGVCKGKKNYDKRQSIAERDAKREMDRARRERY